MCNLNVVSLILFHVCILTWSLIHSYLVLSKYLLNEWCDYLFIKTGPLNLYRAMIFVCQISLKEEND